MTVFGFGRQYRCCEKYLSAVPAGFTLGFVAADLEQLARVIDSVFRDLPIQVKE